MAVIGVVVPQLCNGCAKKGLPGGGPPDTTPPRVVATVPASGDVKVGRRAEIQIEFSEPVERIKLLPNLFVSPPLQGEPQIKWSGRRVRLRWNDSLHSEITYRVTIGGKLPDQHNNPLGEAFTFAFSTGAQIDSGRIVGRVWTGESGAGGLEVFAYRLDSLDIWNLDAPDFVTLTGEGGSFDLPYLPPARYRLIAVADKNRNHKPDPNETVALPLADVDLTKTTEAKSIEMFTHVYDTSSFAISGCSPTDDGSVLVGLTHAVDTSFWNGAPFILLDSVSGETLTVEILRPTPPRYNIVPILSEQLTPGRTYRVAVEEGDAQRRQRFRDERGKEIRDGVCSLIYPPVTDTTGPRVSWTTFPSEEQAHAPTSPIQIGFNEPIDTVSAGEVLRVYDSLGNTIAGIISWPDKRQLSFSPTHFWPETTTVVVSLDSTRLQDRIGNPAPAQTLTWTFTPLPPSRMGVLACRIDVSEAAWQAAPCRLEAHALATGTLVEHNADSSRTFDLSLPAGEWILTAYLDLNEDGRFSPGAIKPYQPAEPKTVLADTLTVRARFTLEDVVIRF